MHCPRFLFFSSELASTKRNRRSVNGRRRRFPKGKRCEINAQRFRHFFRATLLICVSPNLKSCLLRFQFPIKQMLNKLPRLGAVSGIYWLWRKGINFSSTSKARGRNVPETSPLMTVEKLAPRNE